MFSKPAILSICIDDETRERLTRSLCEYQLHLSNSISAALSLVEEIHPALILLEIQHGADANTMMLCRQLRTHSQIPLLILGPHEEGTLVRALYEGADDYLFLPVNMSELRARIFVRLRTARLADANVKRNRTLVTLESADGFIKLHPEQQRVWAGKHEVHLTKTEFDLLQHLMQNAGTVLTHRWLVQHLWESQDGEKDIARLRVHMCQLRRKIEPETSAPRYIHAQNGRGYIFYQGHTD